MMCVQQCGNSSPRRRATLLDRVRSNAVQRTTASATLSDAPFSALTADDKARALVVGDISGAVSVVGVQRDRCALEVLCRFVAHQNRTVCALSVSRAADTTRLMTCADESVVKFWSMSQILSLNDMVSSCEMLECAIDAFATLRDGALSPFGCGTDAVSVDVASQLTLYDTRGACVRDWVRMDASPPTSARFVDEQVVVVALRDGSLSIFDVRQLSEEVVRVDPEPSSYAWGSSWSVQLRPAPISNVTRMAPPLLSWAACGAPPSKSVLDAVSRCYKRPFGPHPPSAEPMSLGVCVNDNASLLATTRANDSAVKLWALRATGRAVGEGVVSCNADRSEQRLWCAAFSPDGRHLVGGFANGSLGLWRAGMCGDEQRESLAIGANVHATGVLAVTFCDGGNAVASLSADGVRVRFGAL
jgi:WD40 repeat protein